jgi:hypothetical protein
MNSLILPGEVFVKLICTFFRKQAHNDKPR